MKVCDIRPGTVEENVVSCLLLLFFDKRCLKSSKGFLMFCIDRGQIVSYFIWIDESVCTLETLGLRHSGDLTGKSALYYSTQVTIPVIAIIMHLQQLYR